jgi:ABC-2 type transport system ATP-binding protein
VKSDVIGKLAFEQGIPIYELATHAASLEDVFLELTADAGEYTAKPEGISSGKATEVKKK